ncbi:hypothetical protein HYX17_01075 [Candidatus Woesearchaeota archaeon]|nr:hypothetical protein [Candidatus Woesearchaeota archaeon]
MNNIKSVLLINIIIFSLILVLHLVRSIIGLNAQIGDFNIPVWLSYIAIIISAYIIYINYKQIK